MLHIYTTFNLLSYFVFHTQNLQRILWRVGTSCSILDLAVHKPLKNQLPTPIENYETDLTLFFFNWDSMGKSENKAVAEKLSIATNRLF